MSGSDEYAVDWTMPVGTPVYAAREGMVVGMRDYMTQGGPDPKYDANYVYVRHTDKTIASYQHLMTKGVTVRAGDQVSRGTLIGHSGNTGFSTEPHLHFCIFRAIRIQTTILSYAISNSKRNR